MPFTFSHPAIILPVHAAFNRWTSLTGLVASSLAPDFEKFIRMEAYDPYSHTWRSIFYFNLPLGLLLTFVFHLVVRDALIHNLPGFMSRRLSRFKQFDWVGYFRQNYLIVILSIILGAASHIFWDSFTHREGRAVGWLPFLLGDIRISGHRFYYFFILQLLSSLFGALYILYAILKLPPVSFKPHSSSIFPYWLIVLGIAAVVIGLKFWLGEHEGWDVIFIYISAIMIGMIAASVILKRLGPS
jgi:hypothetical protein